MRKVPIMSVLYTLSCHTKRSHVCAQCNFQSADSFWSLNSFQKCTQITVTKYVQLISQHSNCTVTFYEQLISSKNSYYVCSFNQVISLSWFSSRHRMFARMRSAAVSKLRAADPRSGVRLTNDNKSSSSHCVEKVEVSRSTMLLRWNDNDPNLNQGNLHHQVTANTVTVRSHNLSNMVSQLALKKFHASSAPSLFADTLLMTRGKSWRPMPRCSDMPYSINLHVRWVQYMSWSSKVGF